MKLPKHAGYKGQSEVYKDIVDIKGIVAVHIISVLTTLRLESFTFASADVAWMDDDALLGFVKSSPLVDPDLRIVISRGEKFCTVRFNYISFKTDHHRIDKRILQETRGIHVLRAYLCGKSGNGDPRFYKEVWWVFHEDSPCENAAELIDSDICRFTSGEAVRAFVNEYKKEDPDRPYFILHKAYYRLGV